MNDLTMIRTSDKTPDDRTPASANVKGRFGGSHAKRMDCIKGQAPVSLRGRFWADALHLLRPISSLLGN